MEKKNPRNAGRKPRITEDMLETIQLKRKNGMTVASLAEEYGVSRQTMSGYLNTKGEETQEIVYKTYKKWVEINKEFRKTLKVQDYLLRMEFMCEDELCTSILVNFKDKQVEAVNYTNDIIHQAFGVKAKPNWEDFEYFIESRCFPRGRDYLKEILRDLGLDFYDPIAIIEKTKGRMAEDKQWIQLMYYRPE